MKLGVQSLNFKGYDAAPLKRIYLEEAFCDSFVDEMKQIASKEGFEIKTAYDDDQWIQDDKTIIEKEGRPYLIANNEVSDYFMDEFKKEGIEGSKTCAFLSGGDTFIGKYPNGEKWILTGAMPPFKSFANSVSQTYGIDKKNIYTLPKQNYHLDTFVRPVGYPYVLVNDFSLVDKNIDKLNNYSDEFEEFKLKYETFKSDLQKKGYMTDVNYICKTLENLGFVPIKIAGVYGAEINFMNAIVNKHSDNTLSYITNSSISPANKFYSKAQYIFEEELKQKVPEISKTYFVKGKEKESASLSAQYYNYMMRTLKHQGGGIHCMSLEEPNFEICA